MSCRLLRVGSWEGILNGHSSLYVTVVKYEKYREVVTLTNCELPDWNDRQLVGSGHWPVSRDSKKCRHIILLLLQSQNHPSLFQIDSYLAMDIWHGLRLPLSQAFIWVAHIIGSYHWNTLPLWELPLEYPSTLVTTIRIPFPFGSYHWNTLLFR